MAENKKSFIAYSDWHGMFNALPDEVAGKLIKHIFSYVNDENPLCEDFIINALFEQIKATLKRDLIKWDEERRQRSDAGKKSAELRAIKFNERSTESNERSTGDSSRQRNPTDSVSVSVSDSDKKKKSKSPTPIFIPPTIEEVKEYFKEKGFSLHTAETAFYYYENLEWSDSKGNKIANWKNKMLSVWMKEEVKVKPQSNQILFPR
jgi:hypothetical protein